MFTFHDIYKTINVSFIHNNYFTQLLLAGFHIWEIINLNLATFLLL